MIEYLLNAPRNMALRNTGRLKPMQIMYAVTDRCNSRCTTCNIWSSQPKLELLTPEEVRNIFSQSLFSNVRFIINSGGEPSTRSDLNELFYAEHDALPKAKLQVSTNALLPDKIISLVKSCQERDICVEVGTSLDGVGGKHDESRGVPGNFEKVDYLIRKLDGRCAVGFVLTEETAPNLRELRSYLKTEFNIEPLVQWYNEARFYSNTAEPTDNGTVLGILEGLPASPTNELWIKHEQGKATRFPCYTLNTFFALKCNGEVVPCLKLWDMSIGNLRDLPADAVWTGTAANRARHTVKNCRGCFNAWGVEWSYCATMYQFLWFYTRHPDILLQYRINLLKDKFKSRKV